MITSDQAASGNNLLAVVGATFAGVVFFARWRHARRMKMPATTAEIYMILSVGFFLAALQRAYWQGYYLAVAEGWEKVSAFFISYQEIATALTGLIGFVSLMHVRVAIAPRLKGWWWPMVIALMGGTFFVGAYFGPSYRWVLAEIGEAL